MDEDKKPKDVEAEVPKDKAEATAVAEPTEGAPEPKPKKRKVKRTVTHGQIHVLATFNNTIISVTDPTGNVLTFSSAGAAGFRGSKKGTAYAAQVAAEKAIGDAKSGYGLTKADVFVKGIGLGRDAAVRTLINQKVEVESIKDITGIPHGGTRPRKARRT
jgi:small subunit ribosomal protein S11